MVQLEDGEHIVEEVRKHWIVILGDTIFSIIIALLPLVFYALVIGPHREALDKEVTNVFFFLYNIWLLCTILVFFANWTKYYLDVWVVTNKRIIDIDQKKLWHRDIASLRLEMIQDVKLEVTGVIATFFKIGDLNLQTAASEREFLIKNVSQPEQMKEMIMKLYHRKLDEVDEVTIVDPASKKIEKL
jgi:hypothetical protein